MRNNIYIIFHVLKFKIIYIFSHNVFKPSNLWQISNFNSNFSDFHRNIYAIKKVLSVEKWM
jgi:hypothetical protein